MKRRVFLTLLSSFAASSANADQLKEDSRMSFMMKGAALVRKALANGSPVDQPIPNNQFGPYALLSFNQTIHDNLNAFDPSDSSFVIPADITHAEFRAQVVWQQNNVGLRQLVIQRKSPLNVDPTKYEFFPADPVHTQMANNDTTTDMETGTAGLIPVQAGERYAVFPLQDSGTIVPISGGTGTVFGAKFYSFQ